MLYSLNMQKFVFHLLLSPQRKVGYAGFKLWIQIDQTDFTGWMSFLPSNIIEEINPNP